ncbi:MAG: ABC-type transport auxiliary lipoprotein family protein [Desulfobia sp.]
MRRPGKSFSIGPVVITLALLCTGCLGKPGLVEYYYLSSRVGDSPFYPGLELTGQEIVAVGPVHLPPELEQAGIVIRSGEQHRLKVSRTRVWSAALEELMAAALTRNLSVMLDTDQVEAYPGSRFVEVRYQIELEVLEFSGDLQREFSCVIVWSLNDNEKGGLVARKRFVSHEPIKEGDYEGYVAAASQSLVDLAEEISAALAGNPSFCRNITD